MYAANNEAMSRPIQVNDHVIRYDSNASTRIPKVSAGHNGFVVTWMEMTGSEFRDPARIYAQFFDSDGNPINNNRIVNDENERKFFISSFVDYEGNYWIIWSNAKEFYGQKFSPTGVKLDDNMKLPIESNLSHIQSPVTAVSRNGQIVLVWNGKYQRESRHLRSKTYKRT